MAVSRASPCRKMAPRLYHVPTTDRLPFIRSKNCKKCLREREKIDTLRHTTHIHTFTHKERTNERTNERTKDDASHYRPFFLFVSAPCKCTNTYTMNVDVQIGDGTVRYDTFLRVARACRRMALSRLPRNVSRRRDGNETEEREMMGKSLA